MIGVMHAAQRGFTKCIWWLIDWIVHWLIEELETETFSPYRTIFLYKAKKKYLFVNDQGTVKEKCNCVTAWESIFNTDSEIIWQMNREKCWFSQIISSSGHGTLTPFIVCIAEKILYWFCANWHRASMKMLAQCWL